MKKRFALFSLLILLLLVLSQVVWVNQMAQRDKSRFKAELSTVVDNMVKHQATKQVYQIFEIDPLSPGLTLRFPAPDSIPEGTKIYGNYEPSEYIDHQTTLSRFVESAMTEMLFEKDSLNLLSIDTLFRNNFDQTDELEAYSMKVKRGDQTIDSLYIGEKARQQLKDSTAGVYIEVPLGTSGTYRFVSHFVFNPSVSTGRLIALMIMSGVAVIAVGILLFVLLFQLQRQVGRLQWQETRVWGMVHDLKSPLSYVYSMLGILVLSEQDLQKNAYLTMGKSRVKQLSDNIELLLTEMKILGEKERTLRPEPFCLQKKCMEIIDNLRMIYRDKNINDAYSIEPGTETLWVDGRYFDNCLRNLFDNGVKYSGENPLIRVRTTRVKQKIRIDITDNGIGIPKKEQRWVFSPFSRLNKDSAVKGHGMGLTSASQIVKLHGGKISLVSEPGKGTTFTICIPDNR